MRLAGTRKNFLIGMFLTFGLISLAASEPGEKPKNRNLPDPCAGLAKVRKLTPAARRPLVVALPDWSSDDANNLQVLRFQAAQISWGTFFNADGSEIAGGLAKVVAVHLDTGRVELSFWDEVIGKVPRGTSPSSFHISQLAEPQWGIEVLGKIRPVGPEHFRPVEPTLAPGESIRRSGGNFARRMMDQAGIELVIELKNGEPVYGVIIASGLVGMVMV